MSLLLYLSILLSILTFILFIGHELLPKVYVKIRLKQVLKPKKIKLKKNKKKHNNWGTLTKRIEQYLEAASLPITPREFIVVLGWSNFGIFIIAIVWSISIAITLFGFFNLLVILTLMISKKNKRKKLIKQLPEALNLISNSLKTGYSLMQAIDSIAQEEIDPISNEFRQLFQALKFGENFDKAFLEFAHRINIPDLSMVVDTIIITRETGGNMTQVIDSLIEIINARKNLQSEIKALSAQGRISALVIGILPNLLFFLLYLINPSYISILFIHPIGWVMIGYSITSQIIGLLLIKKIVGFKVR